MIKVDAFDVDEDQQVHDRADNRKNDGKSMASILFIDIQ